MDNLTLHLHARGTHHRFPKAVPAVMEANPGCMRSRRPAAPDLPGGRSSSGTQTDHVSHLLDSDQACSGELGPALPTDGASMSSEIDTPDRITPSASSRASVPVVSAGAAPETRGAPVAPAPPSLAVTSGLVGHKARPSARPLLLGLDNCLPRLRCQRHSGRRPPHHCETCQTIPGRPSGIYPAPRPVNGGFVRQSLRPSSTSLKEPALNCPSGRHSGSARGKAPLQWT